MVGKSTMDDQALSGTDIKWVDTTLGNAPWPCGARNGDLATKTAVMLGATVVIAKGCVTAGDKGGGMFYWNPSSTELDNGGTVVDTTCLPVRHSGRWIRIYDGLMDVRWFGARGDGTTDDTQALQKALDEVRVRGGSLFFPPGRYIVSSTLDAGASQGVRYFGGSTSSRGTNFPEDGNVKQWPTTLVWMGGQANSDVLFKWGGSHCIFDGIGFQGGWDSAPNPPGIGFLMYKSSGLGTGKGSFPRIQISHAAVGFQCAELRSDDNCDTCNFGRFHIKGCGVGFRVKNDQGVAHSFAYAKFDDTGVCFDFDAGGPLDVQHLHGVRTPVLLNISGAGLSSAFRFGFITLDAAQNERVVWVKHTAAGGQDLCYVTIEGGQADHMQNQGLTNPPIAAFQMGPRSVLRVRNVTGGMTFGTQSTGSPSPLLKLTGTSGRTCSAIFDSCGLDDTNPRTGAWLILAGSGSTRHRALRDCYRTSKHARIATIEATS
jgi:Pectate lyase superfamily protein